MGPITSNQLPVRRSSLPDLQRLERLVTTVVSSDPKIQKTDLREAEEEAEAEAAAEAEAEEEDAAEAASTEVMTKRVTATEKKTIEDKATTATKAKNNMAEPTTESQAQAGRPTTPARRKVTPDGARTTKRLRVPSTEMWKTSRDSEELRKKPPKPNIERDRKSRKRRKSTTSLTRSSKSRVMERRPPRLPDRLMRSSSTTR